MIFGEPIFEIAIYRKSPEVLEKEQDALFEKQVQWVESQLIGSNIDYRATDTFKHAQGRFFEKNGAPYPYNQIIGWVVLIACHDQILAEYFEITEKRLTRNCRRHPVKWQGKAFNIYIVGDETNEEITKEILEELRLLPIEGPFKKRYVDTRAFENIAPYINWKQLLKNSP